MPNKASIRVLGPFGADSRTSPARARRLLRNNRARVVQHNPMTIQLLEGGDQRTARRRA